MAKKRANTTNTSVIVEDVSKNITSKTILGATAIKNNLKLNRTPNAGLTLKSANLFKKGFKTKTANKITALNKISQKELSKPILNAEMMKAGVESLLTVVVKLVENQGSKSLFQSDVQDIFLLVASFRVAITPSRYLRFSLPHTLWTDTSDVCLFVRDSRKRKKDYEPSVRFYQDILQKNNVTEITQVIPMKQLLAEYKQYEQRRQLCNQFDMFLSDGKICGNVLHYTGNHLGRKKKIPTPIKMDAKNLKNEITRALSKTVMALHSNGNSFNIKVGHTGQSSEEILANIQSVCNDLSQEFPGGWNNIKNLYIKTEKSLAIPIYVSMCSPNEVKVPHVEPITSKLNVPVEGEVSTMLGMRVCVLPGGDIFTVKEKIDSDLDSDTEVEQLRSKDKDGKSKRTKGQEKCEVNEKGLTEKVDEEEAEEKLAEAAEQAYLTEWKRKRQDDDEVDKRDNKSENPKKKKSRKYKKTSMKSS